MKYSEITWQQPWKTPVYDAQCFTTKIARIYAKNSSNVSTINHSSRPPFCLRILPAYRTAEMQTFRDDVARITRNVRKTI